VTSSGPAADRARSEVRTLIGRRGHAVDNARHAAARLERAFDERALERTAFLDRALADLAQALDQAEGVRLGGKSPEAARFILRAIDRALDEA
jgi:hypothetical protein